MSEPQEGPKTFAQLFDERSRQPGRGEAVERDIVDNPAQVIEQMRDDVHFADAVAFADMMMSLQQWFSDRTDVPWDFDRDTSGNVGSGAAGVEWVYQGRHDHAGTFNGLPATGRDVEAHGYTLFTAVSGTFEVRRYIDWAGLYAQLGLMVNWRVPMDPDPSTRS